MSRYWVLFFLVTVSSIHCAKILGLFPLPSTTHLTLANALFRELASRGHEVTMISPFPLPNPPANYHQVILTDVTKIKGGPVAAVKDQTKSPMEHAYGLFEGLRPLERSILGDTEFINFLNGKPQFDLVIQLWYNTEALLGVGHAVNATTVGFSAMGGAPFQTHLISNPTPYSYVPNIYLPFTDDMSFIQRLINTIGHGCMDLYMHYANMPFQRALLKEYFPNAPSLDELMRDVDLIFVNSHYSTLSARPHLPGVVEIGGFHMAETDELTDDLQHFMDTSKHGVILFSLGTAMGDNDLTKSTLESILETFKNTKYDILWKFGTPIANLPKNVKTLNWIPQRGVLAHKNIKAFITHGGLVSIIEAVYWAVPLICFPLFTDQPKNAADIIARGYGIALDLNNINAKIFSDAIDEITSNPSYGKSVRYYSDLLRNQEVNPMNKAVYWVEHAIRHKGAKHLRATGSDLPWYQYMLLDVFGFIAIIILMMVIIFIFAFKKCNHIYYNNIYSNKKIKVK